MESATEVFLKEVLEQIFARSRANGVDCIATRQFKRQVRKEEDGAERGTIQRNPAGLLPVEMEVQANREPLNIEDLRLGIQLSDTHMKQDPFLSQRVALSRFAETYPDARKVNGFAKPTMNGTLTATERANMDDVMAIDDWSWRGGTKQETDELMSVLDDCLAVG